MTRSLGFMFALICLSCIPPNQVPDDANYPFGARGHERTEWERAVWTYEHRSGRRDGWILASKAEQVIVISHDDDPILCARTPAATCTAKTGPGSYVVEYDVDAREYLCHEYLHVLLWEAGVPAERHHDWMMTRRAYRCEGTFGYSWSRRRTAR